MTRRLLFAGVSAILISGCSAAAPTARATPRDADPSPTVSAVSTPSMEPSADPARIEMPAAPAASAGPITAPSATLASATTATAAETPATQAAAPEPAPLVASATLRSPSTTRPAEVTAVKEGPSEKSPTLLQQFDAELNRLIHDEPAADPFAGAPSDERSLLQAVIDSLVEFRHALKDQSGLLAAKTTPLLNLSEHIREQIPLTLPTLTLCRSVTQFGVYDPFEPARFTAGKETPFIIYCEVDHFRSEPASADAQWQTKLKYEAVLYTDGDHPMAVISKRPTVIVDRCRNRRRDFFLADRMTLPANLPVGKYLLKVTVIDLLANHVSEKTAPLTIAPN